jgi:transcriptional regulator with XRE-family HTH domain
MSSEAEPTTFGQRLAHLRQTVHPANRGPYTFEEVARGVRDLDLGFDISATYIWQLENGKRSNPTLRHMEGLAAFFGVPASYFLDPAIQARVDKELELLSSLRDERVHDIALRARGVSGPNLDTVRSLIENIRRIEHLDEGGDGHDGG